MVNIPVPQSTKVGETSTDEKDSTNNIPDDNLRMLSTDYLEGLMDKRLGGHLKTYNQRLNVIETSMVKISEWASNSLEFQMMIKDRIIPAVNKVCNQINELQKKKCVVNPYENQFKEDKIIKNLNKKIESNERGSCDVLAKLKLNITYK